MNKLGVGMSNKPHGLLGMLHKAGLIELEDSPDAVVVPPTVDEAPAPVNEAAQLPAAEGDVEENLPLEKIYAEGNVPASPYPAERLLKVLNGLRAMDIGTRKAAILAIDAADDDWKIEDVLLDADRKIKALEARKQYLAAQTAAADAAASEEIQRRERKQQDAVAAIRQQITELQAMMEREVASATRDKNEAEAKAAAAHQACERETARLNAEIARLQEVPNTFGAKAPAT
jgi:hypothetical protein